ncbi:unnamed protein product [Rhizophagus irregularis]|nr:unnamed protein product [Rhizophagus irregularis]
MLFSHSEGFGTESYTDKSTMKRPNDYGNQSHDNNQKKPRFGQSAYSGNNYSLGGGMRGDLVQGSSNSDLYSHFPPVGPSAMMMGNPSYSQGTAGFHHHPGHTAGHFATMSGYHQSQYATSMSQYTPNVSSMVPQFSGAFSAAQFPTSYQQTAVAAAPTNATGRTVYLGNLPPDAPVDEILNQVRVGPIESVRILADKSCAFISFMDGAAAMNFYQDASTRKNSYPRARIEDETITESTLREDLSKYGPIDTVKIVREKNIGFVHFLTIASAMKAVQSLPTESKYANKKVNYGKDRCAQRPNIGNGTTQYAFPTGLNFQSFSNMGFASFDPYQNAVVAATSHLDNGSELRSPTSPLFSSASSAAGSATSGSAIGNRTIYLGNIHPDTSCEEICNVIRGGILQQIRGHSLLLFLLIEFEDTSSIFDGLFPPIRPLHLLLVFMLFSHSEGFGTESYTDKSTMKRPNDYGNQSHDNNQKKPRFGQSAYSGNNYSLGGGMRGDLVQGSSNSDLYSHFPPVGPSAMMMGNPSYSQGTAGFHHHPGHTAGHFATMSGYHQSQYATSMSQYTPNVSSMVPQFSGAFSAAQFPTSYQQTAVAAAPTNATGRTVYLGNLPPDAPVDEILNQVRVGPIESVRILADKSCAFISFMDGAAAMNFYQDASTRKILIQGQELKVGWGKASPVPVNVQVAVSTQNATRNVYLGNLDETITESTLREDLSKYGPIDTVKIVREKNIGFVHFLTIASAMKAVQSLPTESKYANKKVNYGKDRCAQRPNIGNGTTQYAFPTGLNFQSFSNMGFASFDPYQNAVVAATSHLDNGSELRSPTSPLFSSASSAAGSATSGSAIGNRTIYLGNIHPDTSCEEICNVIRGGILQQIRYMPEKHIAFITFIDPNSANSFMYLAQQAGVMVKNRRLKIGWGKNPGPLPGYIQLAVNTQSASRNVYVGQIDDNMSEEKLKRDFSEFGEIELVNILKEKNCGFVNFTSITSAMKAIENIKSKEEYKKFRINYGKDRCGNPPRNASASSSNGTGGKTKGRNNGESDARVLHAGDSEAGNIDGVDDEVGEEVDE